METSLATPPELKLFIKGIILGFSVAAPVGPIGILCIRRTLEYGRLSGFVSGLGAAFADMLYAIIAAFGLTFISNVLTAGQDWLQLAGGIFLLYLGWKTFIAKPRENLNQPVHKSLLNDFFSVFFLTVTNPMTILAFLGVFAALGFTTSSGNYLEASTLVLGVFLGSAAWWLMLSEGVTLFRKKVTGQVMQWINRISGSLIFGFGVVVLFYLFYMHIMQPVFH
jgi:threonine/homoserine/homoserine lactone efflux protein